MPNVSRRSLQVPSSPFRKLSGMGLHFLPVLNQEKRLSFRPVDDASLFCRWLLEDFQYNGATVMLAEGAAFYATPGRGKNEARLAYILNENDLHAAMDCLEVALQKYPRKTYWDPQ